MTRPTKIACGCAAFGCLGSLLLVVILILVAVVSPQPRHVAVINITDTIAAASGGQGLFAAGGGAESIVTELREATEDDRVAAIVLRINSPGGSAAASEEIYAQIMRSRAVKPVVASLADIAASGGYYVASASDLIYSDAATITGSIGVIFLSANLSRLLDKMGVQMEVIKSGRFKDMGSFSRALTPQERALIQSVISDTYQQFVQAVARGRKLPVAKVRALADGRIYSGRQAKQLGLVDKIGGLQDAVREAASRAGITGTPQVREIGRRRLLDRLLDLQSRSLVDRLYLAYYDLLGPTPVR